MKMYLLGMFGFPGHIELLILAFVILLLFGNRLPSIMRSLGSGVVEFKKGLHGVEEEPDDKASKDDKSSKGDKSSKDDQAPTDKVGSAVSEK